MPYTVPMQEEFTIAPLLPRHWDAVREIYEEGIASRNATFEKIAPDWISWDYEHFPCARLVALLNGKVVGWAALRHVSRRWVYRGVAEVSIYITERVRGRGYGRMLMGRLVEASESAEIWTLQAGIFPENLASIAVHEQAGFRIVGIRERIGYDNGEWRDIVFMERRSNVAGIGPA